jgi:2-polyprenyl-3-methyl-5-hydroxy-6-metoxy-1,4-benzoquinol methylase
MPDKLKLLVAIASCGTKNDECLARLIQEYHSMPYSVDVVVLSNIRKALGPGVEVLLVDLRGKNPWCLPFAHKRIFAERLSDYDLFIYSEDDTLIRERNIAAFLEVSAVLPENEIAGFLRYEEGSDGRSSYPEVHGRFHWDPASVRSRGPYTLAFFTNEHSGCYVLRQDHLRRAIGSGGFLVDAHAWRYDLLCSAATDPYTQCGFRKLTCISHLDDFLVHHLPNKYVGTWLGVRDPELRRQVRALLKVGQNGRRPVSLFETGTKLKNGAYSKLYYEPVKPDVVAAVPATVRTVLSIGCGWGATEAYLAEKGMRVSALPLDPVIPGGAQAAGVEIIPGSFAQALHELDGRKFDCLLLSNVLHLVPNPTGILSCLGSLLSKGGTAIAVSPNMARLSTAWKVLRDPAASAVLGGYEKTGAHWVSERVLRAWFRSSGMKIEKALPLVPESTGKIRWLASSVLRPWMADELVVVATKRAVSSAG